MLFQVTILGRFVLRLFKFFMSNPNIAMKIMVLLQISKVLGYGSQANGNDG